MKTSLLSHPLFISQVIASFALIAAQADTSVFVLDTSPHVSGGGNHHYALVGGSADGAVGVSWTVAQNAALCLGGNLVTVDSQAEQNSLWEKWGTWASI